MLIDASYYETVVVRLHFVGHECGHEMDRGLHALVLNPLVLVDEVARSVDRSRDTWVGRSPIICQPYASVPRDYDEIPERSQRSSQIARDVGTPLCIRLASGS
jgi:hypothetical protein